MKHWKFPLYLQKTPLFEAAKKIVVSLQNEGYTAYFVGGAVRDAYLNRKVKEIDIATSAKPEEVCQIFPQHKLVGAHFGVVLVCMDKYFFDVATFRTDGLYLDGRHPVSVEFSDAEHDAQRRDFTINGLFYDPITSDIVDYIDGFKDLEDRRISCIGSPNERFKEDHLRMLRGIRFSAQLSDFSFAIVPELLESITQLSLYLRDVSKERIRLEVQKILEFSKTSKEIELLFETGLSNNIFPASNFSHTAKILLNSLLHNNQISFVFRYLAVVWEYVQSYPPLEPLYEVFLFTKQEQNAIKDFCVLWPILNTWEQLPVWKKKRLLRSSFIKEILECWKCWVPLYNTEKLSILEEITEFYKKERKSLFPKKLISGDTLLQMGLSPSPRFKYLLNEVENQQLEGNIRNEHEAIRFLEKLIENSSTLF